MDSHSEFLPLLLISILAFIVPMVATRLRTIRVPLVVGEIIAGIIFGKSGFNLIQETPVVSFLSEFGFAFLMFLSGLEMDFDQLAKIKGKYKSAPLLNQPIPLSIISFILTIILSLGIGWGFTQTGLSNNPILMGLILCTTSLGIVVPILKEYEITNTAYGQVMLVTALVGDFVTLFLLSTTVALVGSSASLEIFLLLIIFVVFAIMLKVIKYLSTIKLISNLVSSLASATSQIRVRGIFALILIWVVLAQKIGLEIILGAFMAGVIISLIKPRNKGILKQKLDAIGYGFFIPIFFIFVGISFDIQALLSSKSSLVLLLSLIAAAYFVKLIPALVFHRVFSWRNTFAAGFLISSRLSLIIAASEIALSMGMITDATFSALILVALVTCTLSPVFFSLLYRPE